MHMFLVTLSSWGSGYSINGIKLIVLWAREGTWAPSIWPLKTFPQCLFLYLQNKSESAEEAWPAAPRRASLHAPLSGLQQCPPWGSALRPSQVSLQVLRLLAAKGAAAGFSMVRVPLSPQDLPSSWERLKHGCNLSLCLLRTCTFLTWFSSHLRNCFF